MAFTCALGFTGCTAPEAAGDEWSFGKDWVPCESQLDTLVKLDAGTIEVAIIDSVMAGYYTTTGDYKDKIQVIDQLTLAQEEYGIAGRKNDKALMSKINEALIAITETGYANVIEEYGMQASAALKAGATNPLANATDDSWNSIVTDNKIIIGYTDFAPICYDIVDGVPTKGFDVALANKVVAYLNATYDTQIVIEWQAIDWNSKEALLEAGSIDLIWNGMTITPGRQAEMCISIPYLYNKQAAVILKTDAEKFRSFMDIKSAIIGFEAGSAGEDVVKKAK